MNNKQKLELINQIKDKIKNNHLIKDMLKENNIDFDFLDLTPMWFMDLDVSARTQHGVIYFSNKLLDKPDQLDHYALHEFSHVIQQTLGSKPTQGSGNGDYLDNKFEQEAFRNQTEYLSETRSPEVAENYIDKVLDHHEVDSKKEREKRKKKLLQLSGK
jgi:hypothetical protein